MISFSRLFTSSCLGTLAAIICLICIIGISIPILSIGKNDVPDGSVLEMNLSGFIPELSNNVAISTLGFQQKNNIGLQRILTLIDYAKNDSRIAGIQLSGDPIPSGASTLLSIREALLDFKKSDKFIYSYGDSYTLSSYYVSSLADSIFLNPNGIVELNGLGRMIPFYKMMLERLGVKMEVFYAGEFKSATEPYRRNEMSPENRFQTREYMDDIFGIYQNGILESRDVDAATFVEYVSSLDKKNTLYAKEIKLVDKICYQDQFEKSIRKKLNLNSEQSIPKIKLQNYSDKIEIKDKLRSENKIALVAMEGEIINAENCKGNICESPYFEIFRNLQKEEGLKAVILRINSPGGDANVSDALWHEIDVLKQQGIKVISSFGNYAASGGYYIACHSDTIVSMPNTLTGSIGVFSSIPNIEKLLNQKLGIKFDTVYTHPYANGVSPFIALNEEEKEYMQSQTDHFYSQFLERVANGRQMEIEKVKAVAAGRVWSGNKAKEVGLVDVIGDLDTAFDLAQEMTKIDDYKIIEYPEIEVSPIDGILQSLQRQSKSDPFKSLVNVSKLIEASDDFHKVLTTKGVQARLPFLIVN